MKHQKHSSLKRLFGRYQKETISEREKQIINQWFESHEGDELAEPLKDAKDQQRIYAELNERIQQGKSTAVRRLKPATIWLRAASVLLLVGGAAAFYFHNKLIINGQSAQQATWLTIHTNDREVRKITLEDSSEVWLNAATTIRVSHWADDQPRQVYLDRGEAYFKVKHDTVHPFSVITGKMVTRDIGTAFNIRAYEPKGSYRVAVTQGRVDVGHLDEHGKLQLLTTGIGRGQALHYDVASGKLNISQKTTELISAWRTTRAIYADGLTLSQIGEELSRHFDIRVKVSKPELDPTRYTFNLTEQSLNEVLEQLTLYTGISYSLDNHQLTINPPDKRMK